LLFYLCMPTEQVPHPAETHLVELSEGICSVCAGSWA